MFAILLTFIVADVWAVDATLTWDAPTSYVNGDVLPPDHITGYYVAADSGENTIAQGTTATFTVQPGWRCFIVQTIATNELRSNVAYICNDIPGDGPPERPVFVCP